MAEVPVSRIGRPVVPVPQIADGDHAEDTDGRQGAALGAAEGIRVLPRVIDHFPIAVAREVKAPGEFVAWFTVSLPRVPVAIRPAIVVTVAVIGAVSIVLAIPGVVVMAVAGLRGAARDSVRIIVIAFAVVTVPVPRVALVGVVTRIEIH